MSRTSAQVIAFAGLLWLMATITLCLQFWVGDQTIYAKALEAKREALHFAIVNNEAPGGGSWSSVGAQSIQKRVGVVYLTEFIRTHSTLAVNQIYKILDTIFLFVVLVGLFFYLRIWLPDVYCLIGVLYFSSILPLTYHFQLFHPWDRIQLAIWMLLLWLTHVRSIAWLALMLVVSIVIKFDTVLIPIFYGLVHYQKTQRTRVLLEVTVLLVLAFSTYFVLGRMFPAPLDQSHFTFAGASSMFEANIQAIAAMKFRYPPLIAYVLPAVLACFGLRTGDRFVWASLMFGFGLTLIYAVFTHYEEVRTHIIFLILIMPAALIAVKDMIAHVQEQDHHAIT